METGLIVAGRGIGMEWRCSLVRSGIALDGECGMFGSSVLAL